MKIRSGFVSNSSSSSFVVAFPKEPKNAEEVKEFLFPKGNKTWRGPYDNINYFTDRIANTVWGSIKSQKPNNKNEIMETLHGHLEGDPTNNNDIRLMGSKEDFKAYKVDRCKYRQKVAKEFNEDNPDTYIYCFTYSDNNGSYDTALEHGDLFKELPHIVARHH